MKSLFKLSLLVVLLCSTSKLSSQETYKLDFNLDYISDIASNVYAGDLVAVNDSVALVSIGRAIICKTNFKSGKFLDTLENKLVYEKIQQAIKSTELYKNVEFFDESNKDEISTCNHYYIQFRRIIRLNKNSYVCEVAVSTIDHGVLSVLMYFNQDLDIDEVKVLEKTFTTLGVSYMSIGGYFERNDEIYFRSGLENDTHFNKSTPSYFSRFKWSGDYYKFSGFLEGVDHGKKSLYTSKFHALFTNDDQLCTTNGWEIFCFSENLDSCEFNMQLGLPSDQVYSHIFQIGDNRYIAVKKNLDDIGSAINDCEVLLLDESFQTVDTLLQFYIQRLYLNSFDYLNGTAYLYWNDLTTDELLLYTLNVDEVQGN